MLSFNAGLSALRSSQVSMDVVANNIANANTPGYHRQTVHQVESLPVYDGNFWRGTGVTISRINQIASRAIETALTGSISDLGRVTQSQQTARQIESSLAPSQGSIHQRMQEFFDEFHQLQGQPDSNTQRRIVVNKSQSLANEINSIQADLSSLRSATRQQINAEVESVNGKLEALSNLNRQIAQAKAAGQQPNTLLDRQQQLVNEIAETLDIEVLQNQNGSTFQFAQNHVSISHTTFSIKAEYDNDGTVTFTGAKGQLPLEFGGGSLASYQDTLNVLIPETEKQLNELTSSFIQAVDHVQSTGVNALGPFDQLTTQRPVTDTSIPLAEAGLPFDVVAGDLFLSVHHQESGFRSQNRIAIDPDTQSLEDLAAEISQIPHVQAVVDSQANALSIIAEPGYGFDFAGQLPEEPDRAGIAGNSEIRFSGFHSGTENDHLDFRIEGSGQVGVADDLKLVVTSSSGQISSEFNLGAGYEPGSNIDLGIDIAISFESGQLIDGDSFSVDAVADPDTSRVLVALGLNSFFQGSKASDIQVAGEIVDDPGRLAAGRSGFVGDGGNAARIIELRGQALVGNELSFEDHLAAMTSAIAIEVNELNFLQSDLSAFQNNLQREREAISGVDPNEEMVQMLQYQRSFQAAVRVITTIDETLTELMNMVR